MQYNGETLHKYWERFKKLCASCPYHQISDQLLFQYFYEGLLPTDRSMIDAASGGAFIDKTPEAARNLIANMATNSLQFSTRCEAPQKRVSEASHSSLENQIANLTSLVSQLVVDNVQQVKKYEICSLQGHAIDMCLTLQDEPSEQVCAMGGFLRQPQRRYDSYSNTYNRGWRDHPNLSYGGQAPKNNFPNGPLTFQQAQPTATAASAQVDRPTSAPQRGRRPENASAIVLRSGKELEESPKRTIEKEKAKEVEKELEPSKEASASSTSSKKKGEEKEILDMFKKVEVNIPLLDAIKQVPRSNGYPDGVNEDVLVQVNELVFPTNFYVFNMDDNHSSSSCPILLGRPFLKTSRAKIDVHNGSFNMEFDGDEDILKVAFYYDMKKEDITNSKVESAMSKDMEETFMELHHLPPLRVQKGWRVCIDYRKLNVATKKDHFPLPFMDQMLERLVSHAFYCFLDGYSDYNQIFIAPEDQEKMTFTCPFGTFAYYLFMDDFTVSGDLFDACLHNLTLVLKRSVDANLVLNFEKYHFMVDQGIVGNVVSSRGFCQRYIKDFSKIALPLCNLLKKDVKFSFDEACKVVFNKLKELLTSALVIQPLNWDLHFDIMYDASNHVVGAVLGQRMGNAPHVIYYASRTLDDAQCNYSTMKKELFVIVFALENFFFLLAWY
ncbi:uncharacterized protein LOC131177925 [Hevea brasiliensis]|uniref:uncharacterized protein LOC131177925 n=1 Tax=Hevea brasiliensis TaxID=3981 RepID=UPI0025DF1505|nr:uncharacterized protein LOC131177925 [Hevea brasiliensis]